MYGLCYLRKDEWNEEKENNVFKREADDSANKNKENKRLTNLGCHHVSKEIETCLEI